MMPPRLEIVVRGTELAQFLDRELRLFPVGLVLGKSLVQTV